MLIDNSLSLVKTGYMYTNVWLIGKTNRLNRFPGVAVLAVHIKLISRSHTAISDTLSVLSHPSPIKMEDWLGRVAQLVGAPSCTPKGCGLRSRSGHIARLQVQSLVRACMGGNQYMFLFHINVCLSVCLSLDISSTEDLKKEKRKTLAPDFITQPKLSWTLPNSYSRDNH